MYESAEVAYRETQYGISIKGVVKPIAVGPAEAARYQEAGVDIHKRERTVYQDDVTEWRAMTTPADHRKPTPDPTTEEHPA